MTERSIERKCAGISKAATASINPVAKIAIVLNMANIYKVSLKNGNLHSTSNIQNISAFNYFF